VFRGKKTEIRQKTRSKGSVMKFQNLYIGTIVSWVLVVLFEVIGAFFGAWQMKRAKLPLKILYLAMKYGRRTLLFIIAVVNLILIVKAQKKNTQVY
jgi:uncharacterized membrane protein YoaT (DUF817 family)